MVARLPDACFKRTYTGAEGHWQLSSRRCEQRKYALTLAVLPRQRYRHALEPAAVRTADTRLVIDPFETGDGPSVAARGQLPGAQE